MSEGENCKNLTESWSGPKKMFSFLKRSPQPPRVQTKKLRSERNKNFFVRDILKVRDNNFQQNKECRRCSFQIHTV